MGYGWVWVITGMGYVRFYCINVVFGCTADAVLASVWHLSVQGGFKRANGSRFSTP